MCFSGIMDHVLPVTPEEEALYKDIDFDVEDYRKDLGAKRLVDHNDKVLNKLSNLNCLTLQRDIQRKCLLNKIQM